MQSASPIKAIISGTVAGALGASLATGALALLGAVDLGDLTYQNLNLFILVCAVAGIALAFVYGKLPRAFIAQVILGTVVFTAASWIVAFPQFGILFSVKTAILSVVANAAGSVLAMFILHHAIGLALPLVPMGRRAEEFSDNPSEA